MSQSFSVKRRVQFAETDAAGVLHFSNYYRMMEEVEHAFWRSLGRSVLLTDSAKNISWPRVATSCEYFAPVRFEDELELRLTLCHLGDRSIAFETEFRHRDHRIALGRSTAACCIVVDGTFEPISIPESVRSLVAPFVAVTG